MAAELGVASASDAPCRWYIRYTTDLCWHSTIRRNSGCVILLTQPSPLRPKLKNKLKTSVIVSGHGVSYSSCFHCTTCLTLIQIWDNFSHVYGTIPHQVIFLVSPCITHLHGGT